MTVSGEPAPRFSLRGTYLSLMLGLGMVVLRKLVDVQQGMQGELAEDDDIEEDSKDRLDIVQ